MAAFNVTGQGMKRNATLEYGRYRTEKKDLGIVTSFLEINGAPGLIQTANHLITNPRLETGLTSQILYPEGGCHMIYEDVILFLQGGCPSFWLIPNKKLMVVKDG